MLYACDARWWREHKGCPGFSGQKWTQSQEAAQEFGLNYIPGVDKPGLSFTPGVIHFGSNSGYQAINLAAQFGAKQILLLGFDMQPTGDKQHWFGEHAWRVARNPAAELERSKEKYARFRSAFATLPADLKRAGIEVINCTRETALECFPRRPLEDMLCAR